MVFGKYSKAQKEKDKILFDVKQTVPSPYEWQHKTLVERLLLVPQYYFAYFLLLNIYIIYYVVVVPHGMLYAMITALGLFGDGTTYTQLVCLAFAFWAPTTSIWLYFLLANPKRLQWFYNIVGEKRVKSKMFNTPFLKTFLASTVPTITTFIVGAAGVDHLHEWQYQSNKIAAKEANHQIFQANNKAADDRYERLINLNLDRRGVLEATLNHTKELAAASNEYHRSNMEADRPRNNTSFSQQVVQSDQVKHIVDAAERGSSSMISSVTGIFKWGK